MAANTSAAPPPKLTFAKVAASGYKAPNSGKPISIQNTKLATSVSSPPAQRNSPIKAESARLNERRNGTTQVPTSSTAGASAVVDANSNSEAVATQSEAKRDDKSPEEQNTAAGQTTMDDGNTQVSSSNDSAKQTGTDNKSVVSVATFGMDEKESLRPEDSASLKATEEEERLSAQDSGGNESRVEPDTSARAFRDQLREISDVSAPHPAAVPVNPFAPTMILNAESAFDDAVMVGAQMPSLAQPNPVMMRPPPVPDERLIEALGSGRDRVWVLKLEQDIIDFLTDSNERDLTLPQCNSFYRMLAHKLADYYLLEHRVDNALTSATVVIRRTPFCSPLPPPLSALPNSTSVASTPPPSMPARKIMRRDGNVISFPSTTANSEGPSKTTSEAGAESNSDGAAPPNGAQGKTALTREEREAKYNEARLRIFGTLQSNDANDGENKSDEKDESRASSTSGRKKGRKQRNDSDDFEPRSVFQAPQYYAPQGLTTDLPAYVNPYGMPANGQYPMMPQPGPPAYPNGYQLPMPTEQQVHYPYPGQPYGTYAPTANADYDLAAAFQRGMQSFQNTSPSPHMEPKSPMVPNSYGYPQYQPQVPQYSQQWPQVPYAQQYPQVMYMPPQYPERSMPSPGQPAPNGAYPFPPATAPSPYHNGQQQNMHSPMQPSFMGGKFNPQSQTFVPGYRMPPGSPPQGMPQMPQFPPMQPMQMIGGIPRMPQHSMQMPSQQPVSMAARPRQPSSYNSPRMQNQALPLYGGAMPLGSSNLNAYSAMVNNNTPMGQQPLSHPLPTPPNPSSSIAKWGTPSHLPAKPPPPATMEPFKYNELTRGYQGLPGMPFVGPNGVQVLGTASGFPITNGNGNGNGMNGNGATSGGAERSPGPAGQGN